MAQVDLITLVKIDSLYRAKLQGVKDKIGKIVPKGNISNSETYLWTQGEDEGLIKWSRCLFICPRDDFTHNTYVYIILYLDCEINFCPK